MPTFGTSAFLKLVHLNDRPQRTELRKRSRPAGGGYDFHKRMRSLSQLLLSGGSSLEAVLAEADNIVQEPEKRSAKHALQQLAEWRVKHPGHIAVVKPAMFESPEGTFRVDFTPNFGLALEGQRLAIHVWNTKWPRLEAGLVRGVLSLFVDPYKAVADPPDDMAVLCLRTMRLIRLEGAVDAAVVGRLLVTRVESILQRIADDEKTPTSPPDRPSPAPPGK